MQKVRDAGLRQGAKAICGVILQKAQEKNLSDYRRLKNIKEYCKVSLGILNKDEEVAINELEQTGENEEKEVSQANGESHDSSGDNEETNNLDG